MVYDLSSDSSEISLRFDVESILFRFVRATDFGTAEKRVLLYFWNMMQLYMGRMHRKFVPMDERDKEGASKTSSGSSSAEERPKANSQKPS